MKKKAYMAPATQITITHLQNILAGSGKVTLGAGQETVATGITQADDNEDVPTDADSRRSKWDDDDNYDE